MALGTITKVTGADYKDSNKRVTVRDVQLTSGANYTTGGETITASAVGQRMIDTVEPVGAPRTTSGGASAVPLGFDYTNARGASGVPSVKVQAYRYDGASVGKAFLEEVAAGVDLSTISVRLRFTGP